MPLAAVVALAAVVVVLAVVLLAVLVLAVVAEVVGVVCATGVKVPAGTRLFGEVEAALCAFASWFTAATIACAAVSVVEVVVGAVAGWATGVVVEGVVLELARVVLAVAGVVLVEVGVELTEGVVAVVVVVGVVVGVLEDDAGRRGTRDTEKVWPLDVPVLTTGVPVVTAGKNRPRTANRTARPFRAYRSC